MFSKWPRLRIIHVGNVSHHTRSLGTWALTLGSIHGLNECGKASIATTSSYNKKELSLKGNPCTWSECWRAFSMNQISFRIMRFTVQRNALNVISAEKSLAWRRISESTWTCIVERHHMNVLSVAKSSLGFHPLLCIWEVIQERSPTSVVSVKKPSARKETSFLIRNITLVRNLMNVGKLQFRGQPSSGIQDTTRETNPMHVRNVAKALVANHISLSTRKFILERSRLNAVNAEEPSARSNTS